MRSLAQALVRVGAIGLLLCTGGAVATAAPARKAGAPSPKAASSKAASSKAASTKAARPPATGTRTQARQVPPSRSSGRHGTSSSSKGGQASKTHEPDDTPLPPPTDRDHDRIQRMQESLREILAGPTMRRTHVGLRVESLRSGKLFFGRRADSLMDPASNQKILATTTALLRLGSNWRFRTEVSGPLPDDDGVVHGDLHVRGNGDPTLRTADLEQLAAHLADQGVAVVEGGVVADGRRLGDDSGSPDGGGDGGSARPPLIVDRGLTVIRVRPGAVANAPALVFTQPAQPAGGDDRRQGLVVRNDARTRSGGRTRVSAKVEVVGGALHVIVTGKIALGSSGVVFRRRVPRPALHTAVVLRAALLAAGIKVRDPAGVGAAPSDLPLLVPHLSAPLAMVLRRINKDSDNDQAERVLEAVGAEVRGGPATTAKGLEVLRDVLTEMGLSPASYVPHNGSGLGHANRVTASAMVTLLRALYLDPRVGPEILQSLSVGGVDGTTRNRFKGTLAARRVRAKTGTLNSKSCLSGVVGDGGDLVVFSMMVQGFRYRNLRAVRAAQVGAVNAMMRYVREGTGERIDLPTPDESRVGTDYETGSEVQGEESETPEPAAGETQPPPLSAAPGEDPAEAQQRRDRERLRALAPGAATAPPTGGAPTLGAPPTKPGAPVMPPPRSTSPPPGAAAGAGPQSRR